jgi:hypothetical protein
MGAPTVRRTVIPVDGDQQARLRQIRARLEADARPTAPPTDRRPQTGLHDLRRQIRTEIGAARCDRMTLGDWRLLAQMAEAGATVQTLARFIRARQDAR